MYFDERRKHYPQSVIDELHAQTTRQAQAIHAYRTKLGELEGTIKNSDKLTSYFVEVLLSTINIIKNSDNEEALSCLLDAALKIGSNDLIDLPKDFWSNLYELANEKGMSKYKSKFKRKL